MTKSKSCGQRRIPRGQKCHFLIGPAESWFMPNTTDLWTQPRRFQDVSTDVGSQGDIMDCDRTAVENTHHLSYFVYGSIGCFCYGQIHIRPQSSNRQSSSGNGMVEDGMQSSAYGQNLMSAIVEKVADLKENERVVCIRFLKDAPIPIVVALTERGSLIIHECIRGEDLVHFKENELLNKFLGSSNDEKTSSENSAKRPKFEAPRRIYSCSWPRPDTILLGVYLSKDKTCFVSRLKVGELDATMSTLLIPNKDKFILEHHKIELELQNYPSPICLIESSMLDDKCCVIAVGMDDGMIAVVIYDLESDKKLRTIKLARHNDQICSISLDLSNTKKYPLGLLASVARDGLVLIWDIENEFYFADYLALQNVERGPSMKINWFSLRFITVQRLKQTFLAVSNVESGITLLKVPDKTKSKIRLKTQPAPKLKRTNMPEQTIKHNKLIFNIEYEPLSETIITSSHDGNHIIWSVRDIPSNEALPLCLKPEFLYPAIMDKSRTHMLRHNTIREDLMCLALGKGGLKFYSISENLIDSKFDMTPSCAIVSRKIDKASVSPTSIAWHPNHEYRLAVGTIEGRVYRADVTPRKAALIEGEPQSSTSNGLIQGSTAIEDVLGVDYKPIIREEEEAKTKNSNSRPRTDGVYSICWGPNPTSPQDLSKHAIYAVGSESHKLSIYYSNKDDAEKLTNYLDEFGDKSLPEANGQASEVAWKPSMDLMALGTTEGRVIIVTYLDESHQERSNNKLFKVLSIIKGPFGDTSRIQCFAWHPTTDTDDSNYYKIVVSSVDSPAFVFNLKETILVADVRERLRLEQRSENSSETDNVSRLSAYVNKLEAHQKSITDIAWHPHEPNQIATCSFDRTCLVWSLDDCLMDARIMARFYARDSLFTLEWSLVDTNLIYTSGKDNIIWAWRPSENRVPPGKVGTISSSGEPVVISQ